MALAKKIADFKQALERLQESARKASEYKEKEEYSFFRDSTIQRFEFTLEIAWKSIKSFLLEVEGIECRFPKSCVREFFSVEYLNQEEMALFLEMIDDRNLVTYTYHKSLADDIFSKINDYIGLLEKIYSILQKS